MKRFHEIRKNALKLWAKGTNRQMVDEYGDLSSDDLFGSFECQWQNKNKEGHVNLFCSLGDWGCNITDLLKENKYDYLYFNRDSEALVLFRYYTRFLLVLSEMLTDFQDIYVHSEGLKPSRDSNTIARKFYSEGFDFDIYTETFNFINRICKHKTQNIHLCNNHHKIVFEDGSVKEDLRYISLSNTSLNSDKNAILMPSLEYLVNLLLISYVKLNGYFHVNAVKFEDLCHKFKS